MFSVILNGPNRIDVEFSGKLDREEMMAALDSLFDTAKDIENGRMLFRVGEYRIPTAAAIAAEMARIPEAFSFIRKFDKAALLADQKWLQYASEFEGALIPGIRIKAFDRDQEADAEAWLSAD